MTVAIRLAAALLGLTTASGVHAQSIAPRATTEISRLDLPGVVVTLKHDCAQMNSAFAELKRRNPSIGNEPPDCGSAGMAADFDPGMGDEDLTASIAALSTNLERLVAHGQALQAQGAALAVAPVPARPTPPRPAVPAAKVSASSSPATKPRTPRQIDCEAKQYADAALCSDSSCRMATYRKWQQCLKTGRYW